MEGGGDSGALLIALRRILRPLVRLLITRAIPYTNAADILRWVYVDVASREFEIEGKPQTDSRVSLLTGVHRREVKRLRRFDAPAFRAPKSATLGSQLITRWTSDPIYLDASGSPVPLAYMEADEKAVSFERLVRSVSTDIRPRVVLDEWIRLGIVHVDERETVHLDTDAFIPKRGDEEMAYYFGHNLHDHVAAAAHNMTGASPALLERSVHYNNLGPEAVEELERLAGEQGMKGLRAVDQRAAELQRQDSGGDLASRRINFGVYFYTEDTAEPGDGPSQDE